MSSESATNKTAKARIWPWLEDLALQRLVDSEPYRDLLNPAPCSDLLTNGRGRDLFAFVHNSILATRERERKKEREREKERRDRERERERCPCAPTSSVSGP